MNEFPVNRPVSVVMLILLLVLLGAFAYQKLPRDLFPDISQPELLIETGYEGAGSVEVEQSLTRTIEGKLGTVKGVVSMASTSGDEMSRITLTFQWGTNMDSAAMDVRAKLDELGSDLPTDADEPLVKRQSSNSGAVLVFNVVPNSEVDNPIDENELRSILVRLLKPRLERLNGVAAVQVKGGTGYEVRVSVDPLKLRGVGLSMLDLKAALERENISQRGGKLREGDSQYLIRTVGSVSLGNLSQLIVSPPGTTIHRLGELAEISPGKVKKEATSFAVFKSPNADEAVSSIEVAVYKSSGGNSVEISEKALQVRSEFLHDLEDRAQISVAYDESIYINESLAMVRSNGFSGLVLAGIILLVFLGRFQSTVIVVLAMPVSVIATFSLFYTGGISVNIFSMAGLTLAVGMVVDNAIVVTEAIFHKLSYERRIKKAVVEAVSEIGPAVWASTLTTVAVFLPVVFVPGIAGQIFRDLSWVITYTLIFSMVVAFTLIPMLTFKVMGVKSLVFDGINSILKIILWPLVKVAKLLAAVYERCLKIVIGSMPVRLFLIVAMAVALGVSLKFIPSTEFFPETKVESYEFKFRPRAGQSLESVARGADILDAALRDRSSVETYSVSVSSREVRAIASFDKAAVRRDEINPLTELQPVINRLKEEPGFQDVFLEFQLESLNPIRSLIGTSQGDIALKVSGPDLEVIESIFKGDNGLLSWLREEGRSLGIASLGELPDQLPEWILRIKREAAADRNLTLEDIADQVEASVSGSNATEVKIEDESYDIRLRSAVEVSTIADLKELDIMSPVTGKIWKLGEVAQFASRSGPLEITREERERVVTIPIFVDKTKAGLGEVVKRLEAPGSPISQARLDYEKSGYRITLGGASETMGRSLTYLLYAFLVAIVLVYMIMASQFESLIHPFTIMFSVPLSLIGAIWGLRLSGELISLTAMIGLIMLAGIVVNNAIILIDYINLLRARGEPRNDAIIHAGATRLRPILMTALTTVLGMSPLALGLGTGSELYRPLAIVIVCGLSFSTLLTLLIIPAVYCFLDDLAEWIGLANFRATSLFR